MITLRTASRSALAAGLLAAVVGLSETPARAAEGDIVFARAQDADALDVARVSTTISFQVMTQIYETLLNLDDKGKVVGGLASSYTASPDNKTFTFTLRPNIKCHDGSTFDANAANGLLAVVYNRIDVLIVGGLASVGQLSLYAPASRIQDALYLIPSSLESVAFPVMSIKIPSFQLSSTRLSETLTWSAPRLLHIP